MSSGSSDILLRSRLAAGWTSGFSRAASKPPANARPLSFPKFTTSSLNRGAPPTRLTSVLLLPPPSPPLTALMRRDTSTCPLWMSPWPHISARPRLSDGRQVEGFTESDLRRLRIRLRRCDTSSQNVPVLLLLVAPRLRRLSSPPSQSQPLQSPYLLKVGRIEGIPARQDATPFRSARDSGLRLPWIRRLRSPPDQPGRKRRARVSLPPDHPASSL